MWFLVDRDPVEDDGDVERATEKAKFAAELFWTRAGRYQAVRCDTVFGRSLDCLHPCLQALGDMLETALIALTDAYRRMEKDLQCTDWHVAEDVYTAFMKQFSSMAARLEAEDIELYPI